MKKIREFIAGKKSRIDKQKTEVEMKKNQEFIVERRNGLDKPNFEHM